MAENSYPDPDELPSSNYPWAGFQEAPAPPDIPAEDDTPDDYRTDEPTRVESGEPSTDALLIADVGNILGEADSDWRDEVDSSLESDGNELVTDDGEDDVEEDDEPFEEPAPSRGRGRGRAGGHRGFRGQHRGYKAVLAKLTASSSHRGTGRKRGRPRKDDDSRMGGLRGAKRGPRRALEPGQEFKDLHSQASMAFVEGDYDRAEELISEAIMINPEVFTAHSLLSEVYLYKGDKDRAVGSLFYGAHTSPRDPQVWRRVAELVAERTGDDLPNYISVVIYAYGRVLSFEKENIEIRMRRAALQLQNKAPKKALNDYAMVLKQRPADPEALHEATGLCLQLNLFDRGISYYQAALTQICTSPAQNEQKLDWTHVSLMAELFLRAKKFTAGLQITKKFARQLLGRGTEDIWDNLAPDDREFDADHVPRRLEVSGAVNLHNDVMLYGAGIPLDTRVKLGLLRLNIGPEHNTEAMNHFAWLQPEDSDDETILQNADLFLRAADSLFHNEAVDQALCFYQALRLASYDLNEASLYKMADCYGKLQMYDEAEEISLAVSEQKPDDLDVIERLADMFTKAGLSDRANPYTQRLIEERRKRVRLTFEGMRLEYESGLRKHQAAGLASEQKSADYTEEIESQTRRESGNGNLDSPRAIRSTAPFTFGRPEKQQSQRRSRVSKTQAYKQVQGETWKEISQQDVQALFTEIEEQSGFDDAGGSDPDDSWAEAAERAIEVFKSQKVFYTYDKHQRFWGYSREARQMALKPKSEQADLEKIIKDSEAVIPDDFYGVAFTRWLDVFLRYAILMASRGDKTAAFSTCQATIDANIFYHSPQAMEQIYGVWGQCAVMLDDKETLSNVARFFMKELQFTGDSYRMYSALNLSTRLPNELFSSSVNQKFLLRQIKAMDWALLSEDDRRAYREGLSGHSSLTRIDLKTGAPMPPKELNAELLMLYAQIMYVAGSYYEALTYLYRVFALAPEEPLLNLIMGLSYIGWAFKRQSENRHYQILEGLAFLNKYRETKEGSPLHAEREEGIFNMGRTYHMLGLLHLSTPCYEACLEKHGVDAEDDGGQNFAIEAAFSLRNIYAANGQTGEAERITEAWLRL